MLHALGITGFNRLTALSTFDGDPKKASKPFSKDRGGFVMGEGSGMLVLETLEHALARDATPLAEIIGFGSSADAYRITDLHPEGRGPAAAITNALEQANIDPHGTADGKPLVHYISAHGTSTQENDSIETKAIKLVIGSCFAVLHFESQNSTANLINAADVLWWSIVTMSTVGYGDFYPVTIGGRFMAVLLMFCGIGLFAMLAGVFADMLRTATAEIVDKTTKTS